MWRCQVPPPTRPVARARRGDGRRLSLSGLRVMVGRACQDKISRRASLRRQQSDTKIGKDCLKGHRTPRPAWASVADPVAHPATRPRSSGRCSVVAAPDARRNRRLKPSRSSVSGMPDSKRLPGHQPWHHDDAMSISVRPSKRDDMRSPSGPTHIDRGAAPLRVRTAPASRDAA